MGHIPPHQLLTKIEREEAYVNHHAALVDHTINSREYKLGTASYAETGHVLHDKFWDHLAKIEAKEGAAKFDSTHVLYAGFFTPPAKLGELPNSLIFDVMRDRDTLNHDNFAHYHPFYFKLVDHDILLRNMTDTSGGGTGIGIGNMGGGTGTGTGGGGEGLPGMSGSVPEPASVIMVALGLALALVISLVAKRRALNPV